MPSWASSPSTVCWRSVCMNMSGELRSLSRMENMGLSWEIMGSVAMATRWGSELTERSWPWLWGSGVRGKVSGPCDWARPSWGNSMCGNEGLAAGRSVPPGNTSTEERFTRRGPLLAALAGHCRLWTAVGVLCELSASPWLVDAPTSRLGICMVRSEKDQSCCFPEPPGTAAAGRTSGGNKVVVVGTDNTAEFIVGAEVLAMRPGCNRLSWGCIVSNGTESRSAGRVAGKLPVRWPLVVTLGIVRLPPRCFTGQGVRAVMAAFRAATTPVWPRERATSKGVMQPRLRMATEPGIHSYNNNAVSTWPRAQAHIWNSTTQQV